MCSIKQLNEKPIATTTTKNNIYSQFRANCLHCHSRIYAILTLSFSLCLRLSLLFILDFLLILNFGWCLLVCSLAQSLCIFCCVFFSLYFPFFLNVLNSVSSFFFVCSVSFQYCIIFDARALQFTSRVYKCTAYE